MRPDYANINYILKTIYFLFRNELPGISIGNNDDIVDSLTFYRLSDVPYIIKKFNPHLKPELYQAVVREVDSFDPNDLYWSGDQEI